jgi:hypothetical protein
LRNADSISQENQELQNGRSQVPFTTIEARWAPANWGVPLNPTFFVEYNIGTGKKYPTQPGQNAAPGAARNQSTTYPMLMKCGCCFASLRFRPKNMAHHIFQLESELQNIPEAAPQASPSFSVPEKLAR